jgi:hypothetical protein
MVSKSIGMTTASIAELLGWEADKNGCRRVRDWAARQQIGKIPGTRLYRRSAVMDAICCGMGSAQLQPELSAYEKQKRKENGGKAPIRDGPEKKRRN